MFVLYLFTHRGWLFTLPSSAKPSSHSSHFRDYPAEFVQVLENQLNKVTVADPSAVVNGPELK